MRIVASEVVAAPAEEPVTLGEVKAHLRILHASEDAIIARFARAARQHVETTCSIALLTQTRRVWLKAWPADGIIPLHRPPLVSVTSVTYLDAEEAEQTLAADTYHVVKNRFEPQIVRRKGAVWPATAEHPQAIAVTYVCGFGAAPESVPDDIRNAILMLTEHFYFNRGETGETTMVRNPVAVDALLGPHKTHGWI